MLVGIEGRVDIAADGELSLQQLRGAAGSVVAAEIVWPAAVNPRRRALLAAAAAATLEPLPSLADGTMRSRTCVRLGGVAFPQSARLDSAGADFTGGNLTMAVNIPAAVMQQLSERRAASPVSWSAADYEVPWLVPHRLLVHVDTGLALTANDSVTASLDGSELSANSARNARGLPANSDKATCLDMCTSISIGPFIDMCRHVYGDA